MTILKNIVAQKQKEVSRLRAALKVDQKFATITREGQVRNHQHAFKHALQQSTLSVIAEIKRKSPSKGMLASIPDPIQLARTYASAGASTISILTDTPYFAGSSHDLIEIANDEQLAIPLLRKDFIIDELQIAESAAIGANAILCIMAILGARVKMFIEYAHRLGLDVLVEVHDKHELNIALDCGADIIGINNRDLHTFHINSERSFELINDIPGHIIKVAESGISHPMLAQDYRRAGFDAVLVGEALVRAQDPASFIGACRHVLT